MTSTLAGADIRGFYYALGVELPDWATVEASVRCFADPDAHAHEDRDPSCSVNLTHGAWHCWGCGAQGGAYDAALRLGRSRSTGDGSPGRVRHCRAPIVGRGELATPAATLTGNRPTRSTDDAAIITAPARRASQTWPAGRVRCWRGPGRWLDCVSSTVVCGGDRSQTSSISAGIAVG